jgi:tRNA-specific 2-thiouridylase
MIEVAGDSSRDGCWALVRLRLRGNRIVDADADGLDADLSGLTLLEAAAVGGETLAADALANAIGPVFRAAPSPTRIAVAMSGGVDSAVALLRARPEPIGVTLRLWTDPQGPDSERACCSPAAVIAARETCHSLGIPHVTLDLRNAFRRSVVEPFVRGYASGRTPNPCTRCNGGFRFAELLAFASRAGATRLATGHYARIVEHRGRRLLARGVDEHKDQSYMLAGVDPELLERLPPLPRAAWAGAGPGPDRRRGRRPRRLARGPLAVHARPASRAARLGRAARLRDPDPCGHQHRRRRLP